MVEFVYEPLSPLTVWLARFSYREVKSNQKLK